MRRLDGSVFALLMVIAALAPTAGAQVYVQSADPEHPRVLYADTTISANDRCIVRRERLNRSVRPVYVNGMPIGFC